MKNKQKPFESVVTAIIVAFVFLIAAVSSFFIGQYAGIDRIDHDIPESIGFLFSLGFGFLAILSGTFAIAFGIYHRNQGSKNIR